MDISLASPLRLPDELLLLILGYVDAAEWKQVRQTCRSLNILAASLLFERVYFELCTRGCDSLYNISLDPILSSFVKTLVLRRVHGYRKFPDFDTWAMSTHQPGDPDLDFNTARETTYYNNKKIRDQLMPYSEWTAMSREQKEALYDSYNLDREQQQKEVRDITNKLRFRVLHSPRTTLIHPHRAYDSTAEDNAVEQFCEALGTLPKLKALEHEPGFLHDDTWGLQWRDLYFHPYSIIDSTDYEEDEDVEALQLSVVLQSLAWVREGDCRLQEMSIYVGGPAFATPERLQHLWDGDGHELTRTCRLVHRNSAAADVEAYSDFATPKQSKLFWAQLHLMKHALTRLTYLDYRVSDEDELVGSLDTAAQLVFNFLTATSELQNLRLAFGRLADGILQEVYAADAKACSRASIKLLDHLTHHSPWRKLRDVELEIATDRATLVEFLFAHKSTLHSLTLTRTSLVRLGNPRNTWELTLTEIGQGLRLKSLTLSKLCDIPQDWGPGVEKRVLFDVEDDIWKGKTNMYEAYHSAVVGRVIRGENVDSLNPPRSEAE